METQKIFALVISTQRKSGVACPRIFIFTTMKYFPPSNGLILLSLQSCSITPTIQKYSDTYLSDALLGHFFAKYWEKTRKENIRQLKIFYHRTLLKIGETASLAIRLKGLLPSPWAIEK